MTRNAHKYTKLLIHTHKHTHAQKHTCACAHIGFCAHKNAEERVRIHYKIIKRVIMRGGVTGMYSKDANTHKHTSVHAHVHVTFNESS